MKIILFICYTLLFLNFSKSKQETFSLDFESKFILGEIYEINEISTHIAEIVDEIEEFVYMISTVFFSFPEKKNLHDNPLVFNDTFNSFPEIPPEFQTLSF
jgi:hypothetical protein